MELKIVTAHQSKTVHTAWLEINTNAGNFVVMPDHAPTIMTLTPHLPLIICLKNGKQEIMTPKRGVIHITRKVTTLLISE